MSTLNLTKPIAIGSDQAGFEYKQQLVSWLEEKGFEIKDLGVDNPESSDYPDFAHPVAHEVEKADASFGILLCGAPMGWR